MPQTPVNNEPRLFFQLGRMRGAQKRLSTEVFTLRSECRASGPNPQTEGGGAPARERDNSGVRGRTFFLASAKRARTREAPTPAKTSTKPVGRHRRARRGNYGVDGAQMTVSKRSEQLRDKTVLVFFLRVRMPIGLRFQRWVFRQSAGTPAHKQALPLATCSELCELATTAGGLAGAWGPRSSRGRGRRPPRRRPWPIAGANQPERGG